MNDPKALLRSALRSEYGDLDISIAADIDAQLIHNLTGLDIYKACHRVFAYASVKKEVNTRDLISYAFDQGKTVALPKCRANGAMDFYAYDGVVVEGRFGIPEPQSNDLLVPQSDDIMIVPGLAFTYDGKRMGQGGGYYDRYLAKYPCITIGLCRESFMKKEIPTEWNDLPVDYVITENQVYKCKNGASEEAP